MIKKSFRAYNTRRHLEFAVLPHGKVVRLSFRQLGKENIHRALIVLVVLSGLTGIDQIQQRCEVLLLLRGFVPDVADQRGVVERFCLDPEIFAEDFSPSPFVLTMIRVLTSFRMSFSAADVS